MNKEPIALYIFRYILGLGLFAFMAMLYWSSLLLEEHVDELQNTLKDTHNDIVELRSDIEKMHGDIFQTLAEQQKSQTIPSTPIQTNITNNTHKSNSRPQIDPNLPNLLHEDPFYETTLPKMLGPNYTPQGVRHNSVVGKPDNLHPFSNWSNVSSWVGMCTVSLSTLQFGIYETLTPDMAIKIEERKRKNSDATEYWIHLRDGVFWQPLDPTFFPKTSILPPISSRSIKSLPTILSST